MKYFDDLHTGYTFKSAGRTLFDADIVNFAGISGDFTEIHVNDLVASMTPHGRRVAHGMLVASIASGLRCETDTWAIAAYLENIIRFKKPVFAGDTVEVRYEVIETKPSSSRPQFGVVTLAAGVVNQDGATVQATTNVLMVERRPSAVAM